jgi:hypothetical protein
MPNINVIIDRGKVSGFNPLLVTEFSKIKELPI